MTTPTSLELKYASLPPSSPWPSIFGTRFFGANMADLDNDGRDEIIAFSSGLLTNSFGSLSPLTGPQVNTFGVLSYFNYEEISPAWNTATPPEGLIAGAVVQGNQDWGILPSANDQIWKGSIRDTSGIDLLVFDENQTLGLIRWENVPFSKTDPTAQTVTLNNYWWATDAVSGPAGSWNLAVGDQFAIGDVDGDGLSEILIFDSNNTLGLLKWTGGALELIWLSTGSQVPGTNPTWNLLPGDVFRLGDIDGDGLAEIIAFDGSSWLGVMKWINSSFSTIWIVNNTIPAAPGVSAGPWNLSNGDWFRLSDINGDGLQEIVMVSSNAMGALGWQNSGIQTLGSNQGAVSGPAGKWTIVSSQTNYFANFKQAGQASIFVFSLINFGSPVPHPYAAIISWSDSNACFVADYICSPTAGVGPTGLAWTFTQDNLFTCADVDGDGVAEIVIQTDAAQSLGLLKWDETQSKLITLWNYCATADPTNPLPSWGMSLINNAPDTAFTPFTGNQQEIYVHVSESLSSTKSIRGQYDNLSQTPKLDGWLATLKSANSTLWPWMNKYNNHDLKSVFKQIETELSGGSGYYNLVSVTGGMIDLITSLGTQRSNDLTTVTDNLVPVPDSTPVDYWLGQFFDAVLWGMAAVPGIGELAVAGAVAASVVGSLLSAAYSGNNAPLPINYSQLNDLIIGETDAAVDIVNNQLVEVLQDPIKLRIYSEALVNWHWDSNSNDFVVNNSSYYNRLGFYQMLMPSVYVLLQCFNDPQPSFYSWSGYGKDSDGAGTWWDTKPTLNNNFALFANNEHGFASASLITDLFTSTSPYPLSGIPGLALNKWQYGYNPGVIPVTAVAADSGDKVASIFATNNTGAVAAVTVKDVSNSATIGTALIGPGDTYAFGSYILNFGSFYHVYGTVGDNDSITTEIEVSPQGAPDVPYGWPPSKYAVQLNGDSSYLWWEKLN